MTIASLRTVRRLALAGLFVVACNRPPALGAEEGSGAAAAPEVEGTDLLVPTVGDAPRARPDPPVMMIGGARLAKLYFPSTWQDGASHPVVVLLHGFGGTGEGHAQWFDMVAAADEAGALLIVPDGTPLRDGRRFWDATPVCCAFGHEPVDDVGYLTDLIDEVVRDRGGDAERVVVVGHSNGGYMAHRLACDAADRLHAIVSLAGSTFNDASRCQPTAAVNVLNLHGDADTVVGYGDGDDAPGAEETTARWVALNGCADATVEGGPVDLDAEVDGAETTTREWDVCRDGTRVALWTLHGTDHNPGFHDGAFARAALTWALSDEQRGTRR